MSLEHKFHQTVKEWREHCRNTPSSLSHSYLDCDAYRRIVAMGAQVLPLIRDQLYIEYEKAMKYEDELKRLKKKVFGAESVELFGEPYNKIRKDEEYQKYEIEYDNDIRGNPNILWCYAIKEIVPEFNLHIGEKGGGSSIEKVAPRFLGLKVYEVQKDTIKWLDEKMSKYLSENLII